MSQPQHESAETAPSSQENASTEAHQAADPAPAPPPQQQQAAEETQRRQKPTETVEFWRSKAREQEKRAKANAEAATRLAEIEDSQKSEAERATEAIAKERQRADEAQREATSLRIATEHRLDTADAALLAKLPDEEAMTALAERLAADRAEAANPQQPRVGYGIDHSGTQTTPPPSRDDAARSFFGI